MIRKMNAENFRKVVWLLSLYPLSGTPMATIYKPYSQFTRLSKMDRKNIKKLVHELNTNQKSLSNANCFP